jgi:hypothetical protein
VDLILAKKSKTEGLKSISFLSLKTANDALLDFNTTNAALMNYPPFQNERRN